MTKSLAFEPRPRPWSIEPGRDAAGRPISMLRIGARRYPAADLEVVQLETVTERDSAGLAVMGVLFGFGALLFVTLITVFDWRTRFLIGTTFLGALAMASFGEAWGANRITLYRLHIRSTAHGTVVFASADAAEIAGLMAALKSQMSLTAEVLGGSDARAAAA